MKIYSWNINGLRAVLRKGALQKFIESEKPDILCLQEIKAKPEQVEYDFPGYKIFWNPAKRPGYSGTAILVNNESSKEYSFVNIYGDEATFAERGQTISRPSATNEERNERPSPVTTGARECVEKMPVLFCDDGCLATQEGRIIVLDCEKFYLVNVYTPNSKPDLSRLELREKEWDPGFLNLLEDLEKEKPVITCGDFNAAHEEIDLARPKTNHHSAGFTNEERRGITNLVTAGFLDTFRTLHPDSVRYTWWSHWGNARANNVGWRIDYFFVSSSLKNKLKSAEIYESYMGSDHCPISIEMEF